MVHTGVGYMRWESKAECQPVISYQPGEELQAQPSVLRITGEVKRLNDKVVGNRLPQSVSLCLVCSLCCSNPGGQSSFALASTPPYPFYVVAV